MSYYHCPRLLPLGGLSLQPRASRIDFAQFFAAGTQEPSFIHEIVRDNVVCVKELCVCVCVYSNVLCQELCVIMVCEKTCVCDTSVKSCVQQCCV